MAKGKGGDAVFKRFWIKGTDDTRRSLRVLAAQLDASTEVLAGMLLADALKRAQADPDSLRRVVPRKREGK